MYTVLFCFVCLFVCLFVCFFRFVLFCFVLFCMGIILFWIVGRKNSLWARCVCVWGGPRWLAPWWGCKGTVPLAYENFVGGHKICNSWPVFVTKLLNTHTKLLRKIHGQAQKNRFWKWKNKKKKRKNKKTDDPPFRSSKKLCPPFSSSKKSWSSPIFYRPPPLR